MKRVLLYGIVYALNIVDYIQTVYWTSRYGIAVETNPLMRSALQVPCVFPLVKLVGLALLLAYMWRKKHDDSAWMALGMFVVTVIMNFRVILG